MNLEELNDYLESVNLEINMMPHDSNGHYLEIIKNNVVVGYAIQIEKNKFITSKTIHLDIQSLLEEYQD
jgi:hypothetical protein